jgi:hypothetical protein
MELEQKVFIRSAQKVRDYYLMEERKHLIEHLHSVLSEEEASELSTFDNALLYFMCTEKGVEHIWMNLYLMGAIADKTAHEEQGDKNHSEEKKTKVIDPEDLERAKSFIQEVIEGKYGATRITKDDSMVFFNSCTPRDIEDVLEYYWEWNSALTKKEDIDIYDLELFFLQ